MKKLMKNFRFQNTGNTNSIPEEEQNEILMNSQIIDGQKP
jgi:hypothetical protein